LDVGAQKYVFTMQYDGALPEGTRTLVPEQFLPLVLKLRAKAKRIVVCYEAGFSGFSLARNLIKEGIECFVMAPINLDEQKTGVANDRLDSRRILGRLDRLIAGNRDALTPVRIPTPEEEIRRSLPRQLEQFQEEKRRLQAQGRALLYYLGRTVPGAWWQARPWAQLEKELPEQVRDCLAGYRRLLTAVNTEIAALIKHLEDHPAPRAETLKELPVGLGSLTWEVINAEIMDWLRFTNRRQPGKFCGLIPRESSTGQSVCQGHITKIGNPRIRQLLVETAWRFLRFQSEYHAIKKWRAVLRQTKSKGLRKKAVVAVARLLIIDLWRLATGQTTLANLGLRPLAAQT
jgi:transposase